MLTGGLEETTAWLIMVISAHCPYLFLPSPDPPSYSAAPTPQCEEIKMTMRRHRQSLGYSKEDLNRLNKAIQRLTVDVNRAESQVRGGSAVGRVVVGGMCVQNL